jgi:uncharacterized protein YoxC
MALPNISFKEFASNPIVALLFLCVLAIGYLHVKHISTLENTIVELRSEVDGLKSENKQLYGILGEINKKIK